MVHTWTVINTLTAAPGAWQNLEIDLAQYSGATGLRQCYGLLSMAMTMVNGLQVGQLTMYRFHLAVFLYRVTAYSLMVHFVDNTPEETYTYTNLNYGQEYLAGVAALFSSGYSELDTYRFRSTFLPPPINLAGESPLQTNYATPVPGNNQVVAVLPVVSLIEDFEAGVLSA